MRRVVFSLVVTCMALALVGGVALAVTKVGTNGNDTIRGTDRSDTLLGKDGRDDIRGGRGRDTISGGPGNDKFSQGNQGQNFTLRVLDGGLGADTVSGGSGDDDIRAGRGNDYAKDKLSGGSGRDVLRAVNRPAARDIVACGKGPDRAEVDRKDVVRGNCEAVTEFPLE